MTCDGDCFSNYNKNKDDFVIQRLQDIITICEFLIKHKKNSNNKMSIKEMLDKIDIENNKEEKKEEKEYNFEYHINRYKPTKPIYIVPYYNYPWWDNVTF